MSFNYCSHKCGYCFANLAKPGRFADVKATMSLLQNFRERESLAATFLKEGYPILCSNRVDPFATSNYRQSVPILELATQVGVPIAFQTRGGKGVDEVLEFLPPSVWTISITMLDDAIRKRIEPGAPSIPSRLELIEKLVDNGHRVTILLNPLVPEWCPSEDVEQLLAKCRDRGAEGVWIQVLHLNRDQAANLSDRERKAITEPIIKRALGKAAKIDDTAFYEAREIAKSVGLEVFSIGQPDASKYFQPFRDLYPKVLPTLQDLLNACHADRMTPENLMSFESFATFFEGGLPAGEHLLNYYLGSTARAVVKDTPITGRRPWRDLLRVIYSDLRCKSNPTICPAFAFWGKRSEGGWKTCVDKNDLPLLMFNPDEFPEVYAERK